MMRTIAGLILSIAIPGLALGQATTGRISGRVVGEDGEPVAQARVTLVSSALQGERLMVTDEDGRFLAALLPVGPYSVSVAAPNLQPVQVSLRLTVGQTVPLEITMKPGEDVMEKVTVYGAATPLETTVVGENLNYPTEVEELPIVLRDLDTMARLAPNVTTANRTSDPVLSRDISIAGGTGAENAILLDGADLTDNLHYFTRTLYLEDAVEELQVLTAGVSARYGRFAGGVLNAITKSGGNTFHGTVRAEFGKEKWNSQTPFGEVQSDTLSEVYQATLGGYLLKDRLWFFAGGRTIPTRTEGKRTVLTGEDYVEENTEDRWQIKLRGAPAANHTIEASHLDFDLKIENGCSCLIPNVVGDLGAASSNGRFPGSLSSLTYQGVLGPATFLETLASVRDVRSAVGGNPEFGSPIWDGSGLVNRFYNNVALDPGDPIDRDNETLSTNVTHLFGTNRSGTHTLEAGAQYVKSISRGASAFSVSGFIWGFFGGVTPFAELGDDPGEVVFNVNPSDQFNLRAEDLPLEGDQELDNIALYAQDSWQRGKWRVDAGLRWERYRGTAPTGADLAIDADALAPRLGLTFNVRPDLQVQGFWGKYVARLDDAFVGTATGLASQPSIVRAYVGPEVTGASAADLDALLRDDSNWGGLFQLLDPENPTTFLADDLELPYAADFNFSVRCGLPRSSGSVTLSYINRDFRNLLEPQVGEFGTTDVPAPDGPEVLVVDTIILDNTSLAKRRYKAFAATWDYRPGASWSIGGNWTYSETRGNQELSFGNIGTPIGTYERSRPEEAAVPTGFLNADTRHRFVAWGNYRFDFAKAGALVLGGIGRYQSGWPWSRWALVPYSDDPAYVNETASLYVHHFDGRGNNRFDDWWSLDLSGRYRFPIGGKLNGWVKATVVNVLDNDTLIAFNTSGSATTSPPTPCTGCVTDAVNGLTWVPSASFGTAQTVFDYQRPRSYLFTLGLDF